jgi:large subunit ribosomal protein L5
MSTAEKVQPRLKGRYRNEIRDSLHKEATATSCKSRP